MEFALAIGGALASSALPMLLEQAKAKLKKPLPVKDDVKDLQMQLGFISAAIKDHYRPDGKSVNHVREEWIKNLRLLAYEIEDCTEKFLRRVMLEGEETDDTSRDFARDIARLKQTSNDIHQNLVKYDPKGGGAAAGPRARVQERSPASFAQAHPPEGLGKPIHELRKLVREAGSESDRKLKVISILGFGGLGKTLLARKVYGVEKTEFALHAWVRADGKGLCQLLDEILHQLKKHLEDSATTSNGFAPQAEDVNGQNTPDSDNALIISSWFRPKVTGVVKKDPRHAASVMDVPTIDGKGKSVLMENDVHDVTTTKLDRIKQRLKSYLQNRRYLIVIIDMRETLQWPGIDAFPQTNGIDSRIIVTTTKHAVAKCCSDIGGQVYEMNTLSDEDSRKLLFRSRNEPSSPVRPETSQIVDKCGGLPLALLSTRHLLSGKTIDVAKIEQAFREICGPQKQKEVATAENEEEDERGPEDRLRQVLLSTYEGLPNHFVQVCLLYFSMYPGHHVVRRDSLIRKWLAEGLAQNGDDDAVENLDALIDRCIIQSTGVSTDGNMKGCRVPGIVLEYVTRNSSSQDFVRVWDGSQRDELKDVRRLSLHPNRNSQWTLPNVSEPKVRTLAVFSKEEGEATTTLSNKEAIAGYNLLRVLDLEGCGGLDNSDLENISRNLLLLKYLSLGGSITEVPREIEKLQLLETLDLRKTNIGMVPVQVIMLPLLKHLFGKFQLIESGIFRKRDIITKKNKKVRKELETFLSSDDCKLEMLSGFITASGQGFPQLLSHMKKLRKVKVWCDSTAHKKNINDLSEGIQTFLRSGTNVRSLSIDFTGCGKELSSELLISLADQDPAGSLRTPTPSSKNSRPLPTNRRTHTKNVFRSLFKQKKSYNSSDTSRPTTLYSLKLYGELNCFPVFVTELSSITELCLYCTNLSPEVVQDGLNRLKNTTLKYLKLVEDEVGPLEIQTKYFTGLERICLVGNNAVNKITIQEKALPLLVSLHLLCKGLDGLTGIEISSLPSLKEVGLHSGGTDVTKSTWEAAAMSHRNWPNLVLVDQEEYEDVGISST